MTLSDIKSGSQTSTDATLAAVQAARDAFPAWASRPVAERAEHLRVVRLRIHDNIDRIMETIAHECSKPKAEALAHDIVPVLLNLLYYEKSAARALRSERIGRIGGMLLGVSSKVEYRPYGVVGCISAWNYPFLLSFLGAVPALIAGNTIVLKPSEVTPQTGELIREMFSSLPQGVAHIVQGGADIGAAMVDAPCDKICFVGSPGVGRKIAAAAAEHLTPVVMELGGKDAAVVLHDADLDAATSGILWGAFMNAGQTCCSVERIFLQDNIAQRFEDLLIEKLGRTPPGDIGSMSLQRQYDLVANQVEDAISKGAKVLSDQSAPGASGRRFSPTVLTDITADMAIARNETFGPAVTVERFAEIQDAVRKVNTGAPNLTVSVWSQDAAQAKQLSARLLAGSITINQHADTIAVPWAPWGGTGESGYGRLNGVAGIREFTIPTHVGVNALPRMKKLWWYPYSDAMIEALRSIATMTSGTGASVRIRAALRLPRQLIRAVREKI